MNWLDIQTQTGLGLKIGEDQQASILFFSWADLVMEPRGKSANHQLLLPRAQRDAQREWMKLRFDCM